MKKSIIVSLLLSVFLFGYGQEEGVSQPEFKNAIKSNPFGWFSGQYQLVYERSLGQKISLQVSGGYIHRELISETFNYSAKSTGFIVIPEFRYFIEEEGLKGIYFSAFSRIRKTEYDVDFSSNNHSYVQYKLVLGGGLLFGYQAVLREGVLFDVFIGPQFKSIDTDRMYDDSSVNEEDVKLASFRWANDRSGGGLRLGFNFGYAF